MLLDLRNGELNTFCKKKKNENIKYDIVLKGYKVQYVLKGKEMGRML